MAIKKTFINYELADGSTGCTRSLAADKITFEITARHLGWEMADGPRAVCMMLYAALARTHAIPAEVSYDEFINAHLVDFSASNDDEGEDTPDPS